MHIAIDIRPIDPRSTSQHKVRGVGKYINLLKDNLERFDKKNKYTFTSTPFKVNCDVIHYPYFDPFFITLPLRKKTKTVVTVHDLIPLMHPNEFPVGLKGSIKWQANRLLLRQADAIITDSHASKEDICALISTDRKKVHPVYLAAEYLHQMSREILHEKKILDKFDITGDYFLYVGDVTWNKNLPRIVEAVVKCNKKLVLVGKALTDDDFDANNPWNADRKKVAKIIGDSPLFSRLGFVTNQELAVLYKNATALLMPSLDEGFGLPVLEAMEHGCPVITSQYGSLPEVGGDAVIYADAYSTASIIDSIELVSSSAKLRAELKSKGSQQAAKFTLNKMIEDTVSVYEKINNETHS